MRKFFMQQYQISSRLRHLRLVFLIDKDFSYDSLFQLICANQECWGGSLNPIVYVPNNLIEEGYQTLINQYDPDYVYFSSGIDIACFVNVLSINPQKYCILNENLSFNIPSVGALYLYSVDNRRGKVIITHLNQRNTYPLLKYFKINFGINLLTYDHEEKIVEKNDSISIDSNNFKNLNEIMHREKPLNRVWLSALNAGKWRSGNDNRKYEIVVAKDKNHVEDLIYFRNKRILNTQSVIYMTLEDAISLSADVYFAGVLSDLSQSDAWTLVSSSLTKVEIRTLIDENFKPLKDTRMVSFLVGEMDKVQDMFKEDLLFFDADNNSSNHTQTIFSNRCLLNLPILPFVKQWNLYSQEFAMDIEIDSILDMNVHHQKFPLTTDTQLFFPNARGRINRLRNISICIRRGESVSTLDFVMPSDDDLFRQLICRPYINNKVVDNSFWAC